MIAGVFIFAFFAVLSAIAHVILRIYDAACRETSEVEMWGTPGGIVPGSVPPSDEVLAEAQHREVLIQPYDWEEDGL